jgi:hypothetical protein
MMALDIGCRRPDPVRFRGYPMLLVKALVAAAAVAGAAVLLLVALALRHDGAVRAAAGIGAFALLLLLAVVAGLHA